MFVDFRKCHELHNFEKIFYQKTIILDRYLRITTAKSGLSTCQDGAQKLYF